MIEEYKVIIEEYKVMIEGYKTMIEEYKEEFEKRTECFMKMTSRLMSFKNSVYNTELTNLIQELIMDLGRQFAEDVKKSWKNHDKTLADWTLVEGGIEGTSLELS